MPFATTDDGVKLYYESSGRGDAVLFVHEFAGDVRSWEPQMRWFSRRYRCVAYNARGYPPSDVPEALTSYTQARAVADARTVLEHLGIDRAHVVGLSMGSFCALHLGLTYPAMARSLVVAGCGYGAPPADREPFRREVDALAERITDGEAEAALREYAAGPTRQPFRAKDPRGWAEFADMLAEHAPVGSALTLRGVQMQRPSLYDMTAELEALAAPVLLVAGDEDTPSLEGTLFLKRVLPTAGLLMLPNAGHTLNLEEPALFNLALTDFFSAVENDAWQAHAGRGAG